MIPNLLLLFLLSLIRSVTNITYDDVQLDDVYETRSRILMVDGNVWLHAGKDRNITFKTNGEGSIYVGETDVARLPDTAAFDQHVLRLASLEQIQKNLQAKSDSQVYAVRLLANVVRTSHALIRNMTSQLTGLKNWKKTKQERDASRRGLLVRMTRQLLKLNKLVSMNACETNKCENGGTCIPRIGTKFFCLCPPHFTGDKCELDVDECDEYNGTHAGCQNNGTCVNMKGGFQCTCPEGFHGPLCQYEMSSCSRTFEICGPHGQCIDIDAQGSKTKYKCICDWGFKLSTDLNNPTCVDVNECDSNPCQPGVDCINLPGSFQCSGCPSGYKSEGSSCIDINECDAEVGVCDSLVRCINIPGSYLCEPCPAGYSGDGGTCKKEHFCSNNDCNHLAKCKEVEDSMTAGGYTCYCPDGYVGDGLGINGCLKTNTTACANHKCVNGGKCRPINEDEYNCECDEDYMGSYCQKPSPCGINNPCQNEATCIVQGDQAHCKCQPGFYGSECQLEENEECGRHFSEPSGNYTFNQQFSNSSRMCDFAFNIRLTSTAIKISFSFFDNFTANGLGPTNCATALGNLTIYDGSNDNSPRFATFCGDKNSVHAPLLNEPITMTSSMAMLRFRGKQGVFSMSWETVERKCGYRTSKPEGLLSIPQNKQDVVCEWFISAPSQKVIELEIPAVTMHSKTEENCEKNELEVFDGYSSYDLHRISQICASTERPQTVRSTGPFLSVSFISNMLASSSGLETVRGFVLKYKFVDPDRKCGGDIININQDFDFSGSIESPNYGSLYPPNMDCTWQINATIGSNATTNSLMIKLTFDEFDVPSSYQASGLAPLGRFSFRRGNTFRNYFDDRSGRLMLSRIVYREKCSEDYLRVFDDSGTEQYDACNSHRPPNQLTVADSNLILQFHSNGAVQGRGFKIQYELVCQSNFRGNGTIQTWNFPDGGSPGKCTYVITAPRTHAISINFKTIGLRVLRMTECFYNAGNESEYGNYVQLEGGRSDNTIFNKKYFCPKYPFVEENWVSVSAVRPLTITVASDGSSDFKGISLEYKTFDVGCGGIFSSMTGSVESPNYPEKYMPHMHCVYDIYVSWSKIVKLTFETFDLETTTSGTNCEYDRVEIYTSYHNETVHGDLLGKFCGSMLPPAVYSTTNSISLVFVSDRSVSGQGFSAKYEAAVATETCDKTFTSPSGQITFEDPNVRFDKCLFHIAVREDEKIMLKMNNISLPCEKSKLQIRNGPSEQSPGFSALYGDSEVCNNRPMPILRSSSGRVLLVFSSIDSRTSSFNISYEVVANGCGGRIDGLSGSISAPQYPLTDRRNLKCEWTVAVALGNKVRFQVSAIDDLSSADENGFCPEFSSNRLDILDSAKEGSRLLKRYCKKELASEPINSDDNEILVRYTQAGGFRSGKIYGFMGHFTTVCEDIVLKQPSGSIQSPGYPHQVYGNQFCQWTIIVPKGNKIMVTVHHFVIQKQYSYLQVCDRSMLKIDDVDLGEAEVKIGNSVNVTNSINKYCDKAIPVTIKSRHNEMHLTYKSERMPTNQFWLSWTTIGCSADIRAPQQIDIRKSDLDSEMDSFECQYKIQAPLGKKIRLRLTMNIFPTSSDCVYSPNENFYGVALFMGSSNVSGAAQLTICNQVSEKTYLSHTDEMYLFISMKKEHVQQDKFFTGVVEFLETNATDPADACGGIVDLKVGQESSITSPGYPAPYPVGVNCRWLFRAPDGYHINYTLNEFHSPNYHAQREKSNRWSFSDRNNITCKSQLPFSDGMLTMYDKNSSKSGQIVNKYCDETSDAQFLEVFSDESLVTFIGATNLYGRKSGEDEKQKNGFKLTAKPACGGVVYAESEVHTISMYHQGESTCTMVVKKKDMRDSEVFVSIEKYSRINSSHIPSLGDNIRITLDDDISYYQDLEHEKTSMSQFSATNEIKLTIRHTAATSSAIIAYSTNERACGGTVRHHTGIIYEPIRNYEKSVDCEYIIENTLGNMAEAQIITHNLKPTMNCTGSYIEIRENDAGGKLLTRQCDPDEIDSNGYTSRKLWVYFRYRLEETDDEDETQTDEETFKPRFEVKYSKISGGETKSVIIQKPFTEKEELAKWEIYALENENILINVEKLYLPNPTSYIRFSEYDDEEMPYTEIKGTERPTETLLPYQRVYITAQFQPNEDFMIIWGSVPTDYNKTVETKPKIIYDCGGMLTPSWDWNDISNPRPVGQTYGYEENLHCRWTIQRPMFTGIELKFDYLSLENEDDCPYDYVAFRLQQDEADDSDISKSVRHCSLRRSNQTFAFAINRFLHIHFVSDSSRYGAGFKLKYRLTCNSFEHIPASIGFEQELTSPNYNNLITRQFTCQWSIILESNRQMEVKLLDMDIAEESPCNENDVLILSNKVSSIYKGSPHYKESNKYCGTLDTAENVTFTTPNGRIFIKYSSGHTLKKGFKLLLKEITADCQSGVFHLNEDTPKRTIYSPGYPNQITHSTECDYVLAAPNGHRVMLTFDPSTFDLDKSETKKCSDYIEVRDGPSRESLLIGKYCGNIPPSSIYSTSNFLFVHLHTDQFFKSNHFSFTYEIATCGGTIIVHDNSTSHVLSPNYPDPIPSPVQCEWTVRSPNSHMLMTKIENLWLFYNVNCTVERLTVLDGNSTAPHLIPPICNPRFAPDVWTRSSGSQLTVKFVSNSTVPKAGRQYCPGKKCGFDISLKLSEHKCGGLITNEKGFLTTPGYPNRLLPNVECSWIFKAKPGKVWWFKLNFTDQSGFQSVDEFSRYRNEKGCFPDLKLHQTIDTVMYGAFLGDHFCESTKSLTSKMNWAQLAYDNSPSRTLLSKLGSNQTDINFYAPFTVEYVQIPVSDSNEGCTFLINSNQTSSIQSDKHIPNTVYVNTNCHIEIEKPSEYGSVWIKIENYASSVIDEHENDCLGWDPNFIIKSKEPINVRNTYCKAKIPNNSTDMVLVNDKIDLLINQADYKTYKQSFNLTVEFQKCGGVISDPNIGEITSPNFGDDQKYLPNSRCLWVLTAPEGEIVKIKVVEMNIEYDHDCALDYLIIGEGKESEINPIHKFCHQLDGKNEKKLEERFQIIKSFGRFMTIEWSSNGEHEESGWKIEYEFENEKESCGFHTRGMEGIIHSPNYGTPDYESNVECIWDIQVPLGYHIMINFDAFDIESSPDCTKDSLTISQEHSSRADSPMGNYYFLFQDEEKNSPMCGVETPGVFESESNRVRLNFTTDGKVGGRGFKLHWTAVCGGLYRLNHGVITSPNYPVGYPNKKQECGYFIYPPEDEPHSVIALQIVDFDISDLKTDHTRQSCEKDYLEIMEVENQRVIQTLCGGNEFPADTFTIKGGVALKFVTSPSYFWSRDEEKKKNYRGFQITYAINKCGGHTDMTGDRLTTSISSPAFPLQYQHALDCTYTITTTPDRVISAKFEYLDLENIDDCSADYIEIFDGAEPKENKTIGKFCGDKTRMPQYRIRSSGPNMSIQLVTDSSINGGGFKIIVSATLGEAAGCGGKLVATNEWKTLRSPQDEDGNYPGSLQCAWTISGPLETQLQLRLDNIDTEPLVYPPGDRPVPECVDSLAIHDGMQRFSQILANDICTSETTPPKMLFTSYRNAYVFFETDEDGTGRGFNLSYRTLESECGGWLRAESNATPLLFKSKISEENEHKGEKTIQRCLYMIEGSKTDPIVVSFKGFRIPSPAGDCSDAYVEISDVGSLQYCHHPGCASFPHQRKKTRYCGSNLPPAHVANTNSILVAVSTIIQPTERSMFKMEYQSLTDCNRTIDTSLYKSGLVQSPNYPNQYSENTTCTTTLETHGKKLLLTFHKNFELEDAQAAPRCNYDYLDIIEGVMSIRHCGTNLPPTILTTGGDLTTVFKSDHSIVHSGYSGNYYIVVRETDDTIQFADSYDNEGVISSIGYPTGYRKSKTQIFTIRPPTSHDCHIVFEDVSLGITENSQDCLAQDEYLNFEYRYKGTVSSVRLRDCTFRDNDGEKSYKINGDDADRYLKFTFKSDEYSSNNGRGFKVSWSCDNYSNTGKKVPGN